jgi:hypothetical protein
MRVVELVAAGAALMAAMLTSGARRGVRRATGRALGVALVVVGGAAVRGARPEELALAATAVVSSATIAVILGGLVRLVRERGVVLQAVLGALAIYLLVGLVFGFLVGTLATAFGGDYFAQGTAGVQVQLIRASESA